MKRAVTLVELMLAATILVIVFSGVLLLFINCMFLNESNRSLTTAASHAQYVMEDIRRQGNLSEIRGVMDNSSLNWNWTSKSVFETRSLGLEYLTNETIAACYCADNSNCTGSYGDCNNCSLVCNDTLPSPACDPMAVFIRVNWNDQRGTAWNYSINTLMTEF